MDNGEEKRKVIHLIGKGRIGLEMKRELSCI